MGTLAAYIKRFQEFEQGDMFDPPLNDAEIAFRNKLFEGIILLGPRVGTIIDICKTVITTDESPSKWAPPPLKQSFDIGPIFDFDHVIDNDVLENEMLAISNAAATTVSR